MSALTALGLVCKLFHIITVPVLACCFYVNAAKILSLIQTLTYWHYHATL